MRSAAVTGANVAFMSCCSNHNYEKPSGKSRSRQPLTCNSDSEEINASLTAAFCLRRGRGRGQVQEWKFLLLTRLRQLVFRQVEVEGQGVFGFFVFF